MADSETVDFQDVFRGEIDSINKRRPKGEQIALEDETLGETKLIASDGTTPLRPTEKSNVIGLALSGGGVRSAAFCLGALQALEMRRCSTGSIISRLCRAAAISAAHCRRV
jgi:hypothetical protein